MVTSVAAGAPTSPPARLAPGPGDASPQAESAGAQPEFAASQTPSAARRTWRTLALLEVAGMFAVLLSYIWGWQRSFAGASFLIVALYFAIPLLSHWIRGESAADLGLRIDNLGRAGRNVAAIVAPAVIVALLSGMALRSWHFPSGTRMLADAPWMVMWGTAQQYGLLCFFYRRFLEIFGGPWAATAGAALTFAAFHVPNEFLIGVTLAAGSAACVLYRREPNLWVIGVAHALLSFVLVCSLPDTVTHDLRVGPGYFALSR